MIRVEHLGVTQNGYFRPSAFVSFGATLRASGLLAALPPEAVKDLLLLLTFVTSNGHCAPTVHQIAQAMRVSQGKARSRLERLEAARWQARPLLWHGKTESGLEFFSPLSSLAPVHEDAQAPSAYVPPPPIRAASREAVVAHSRAAYARSRAEVEAQIEEMMNYRKAQPPARHQPAKQHQAPTSVSPQRVEATAPVPVQALVLSPEEQAALREHEEVSDLLQQVGLEAEQAEGLLEHYDTVRIRRQLMWLPYRRAKNPAGMLLAAVKDDYEAPPGIWRQKEQAEPQPAAGAETPEEDVSADAGALPLIVPDGNATVVLEQPPDNIA